MMIGAQLGPLRDAQSSKFYLNASSPIGARQWALCISDITLENVKMQAVISQQRQAAHEAQQEGPTASAFQKTP